MKLAVVTLGSAGDLHPYLAIAREMLRRGHDVHFFSQEPHRQAVEGDGLPFEAIATTRDHDKTLRHPGLWHPVGGFGVLWRHLCVPAIRPTFGALAALRASSAAPLTVLASPLAVGARMFREANPSIKLLTAYTAPSVLRSCADPMFVASWKVPSWMPTAFRACLWSALDRWKLEPMARESLPGLRAAWSLGPQRASTFGAWIHSPDGGLALFPRWFAPPQPDWAVQPHYAGFPVYESGPRPVDATVPDARLEGFLNAGPPPVVVLPGTAASNGGPFLGRAWQACRSLDLRCVVLSAYPDQWPEGAQSQLLTLPASRLGSLLPRSAALIHHGGIGSCAQALAAGTPQLIMPSAYDQFDNAYRVAAAGWAVALPKASSTPDKADASALSAALAATLELRGRVRPAGPPDSWPRSSYTDTPNAAVISACEYMESRP